MSTPRVCFVSMHSLGYFVDGYGVTGGGAERQLSLLAAALAERFDVHVVVADYGQPQRMRRNGVVLHRSYDPEAESSPTTRLGWLATLARTLHRVDADAYVHRGTPAFAAVVSTLTRALGKPWVYNVANDANITERPAELGALRRRLFDGGLGAAAEIIAQTPKQAAMIQERYDREPATVPNGYPPADRTADYADRAYVLWVGRLDETQKRPHLFVDLAEALPDTEFRLVGPAGEDEAYHRRLLDRVNALDNCRYEGAVAPDEIHDYYRAAHCLVSTSAHEGFPNTFLEAWRVGTPVVSLAVDPARIAREDSVDGFADGDFEQFVEIVSQVASDETTRRRRGERGRTVFEDRFGITAVAEQYGDVLGRLVE